MADSADSSNRLGWTAYEGGLLLGGLALLLALGLSVLLVPEIVQATREVPTLSPATVDSIVLDGRVGRPVEVEGFELDCGEPHLDRGRMLVPARAPRGDAAILVEIEYNSDCRSLGSKFRGVATTWNPRTPTEREVASWLRLEQIDGELAVVEPHRFPGWVLAVVLGLVGLGLGVIASASIGRTRMAAKLQAGVAPRTEPAPPVLADPYRPGQAPDRLIREPLRPALDHLVKLRRRRITRAVVGLGLLVAALTCAVVGGQRIRDREQTWAAGVEPLDTVDTYVVGKSERLGLGFIHTEVGVTYIDHRGRPHREHVSATSLGHAPDTSVWPTVRYLQDDPDRFAVSWVHEQFRGSLILLSMIVSGLLGGALAAVVAAWRDRSLEQTAAVFEDPREALLDLLGVEEQQHGTDRTYHFCVRDSDRRCSVVVGRGQPGPLFLDRRETVALALYSPRQRAGLLVLSEDLRELEQPAFSAAQLRGRYRASLAPVTRRLPPRRRRRPAR